ncbi:MAG TPA: thermonuclease family protein [Clostridia bacterium]|nr:thermonuclease family protein [Clostridia bacterium]
MKNVFSIFILVLALLSGWALNNDGSPNENVYSKIKGVPGLIARNTEEGLIPNGYVQVYVDRAVDGDTLAVIYQGDSLRVRLLDIDTPESVKQGVSVQPYAKEASNFTRKLVQGEKVKLIFEEGLKDKYGRLLAHVFLKDATYLNALLVRNGYARAEIISPNIVLKDYFLNLQEKAIKNKAGLWSLPQDEQPFVKNEYGEYVPRFWLVEDAS